MLAQLEEIKPIEVRGQSFMITILHISFDDIKKRLEKESKKLTMLKDYFNAYVYLEHLTEKMEDFNNQTYKKDKVVGVDTAHSFNENMSMEAKKEDVYRQIINVIEEYLDLMSDLKEVVKAWEE